MDILKAIAITAGLAILLNLALLWSNNIIFILARKPNTWIVLVALIGCGAIFTFALIGVGASIAFWAALLALLLRLPSKQTAIPDADFKGIVEDAYAAIGISKGRLKYRLGLAAYAIGCIAGYLIGYGEIVNTGS